MEAALWIALGRRKLQGDLLPHSDRGKKSHQSGLSNSTRAVSHAGEHEQEGQLLQYAMLDLTVSLDELH